MKLPIIIFILVFFITFFLLLVILDLYPSRFFLGNRYWEVESIDTMKYSRDLSREKLHDARFDAVIDTQIASIAATGANYVAIGTPYDDEFLPMLTRWVKIARKYHLHVWFRGNFSGWEGWFGYAAIDRRTHINKTKAFILQNKGLFADGDIFSSCPECENGANVQFGNNEEIKQYRQFLIKEYHTTKDAFLNIHKRVQSNYFSMNADVAHAVMDKPTTAALDGIVVVDHYVASPQILVNDLHELATISGGKIVLGEFGAPIPDIHGNMNNEEQKMWLAKSLQEIRSVPQVIGVNYWVNSGGTTALWSDTGTAKPAVATITTFYSSYRFFSIHPPPSP